MARRNSWIFVFGRFNIEYGQILLYILGFYNCNSIVWGFNPLPKCTHGRI